MKKKLISTGCILCFILIICFYAGFTGTYPDTENTEKILYLQIQSVTQAVSATEKISMRAEKQESEGKNEILEAAEETFVEEEQTNGRLLGEINSYMARFTELYTSSVMDGNDDINIGEREIYLEDGGTMVIATLRIYTDLEDRCLRYKVNIYGETMQSILNYYFCNSFVMVSRQNDYYSSWILPETEENDILYSNINKWIIMDDVSYIWQDNGEVKETDTNVIPVPSVEEIKEAIKQTD